jgi:hypothetical protein
MTKLTCELAPWRTWQARALKENLTQTPPPKTSKLPPREILEDLRIVLLFFSR